MARTCTAAATLLLCSCAVHAQVGPAKIAGYPDKPIRMLVPNPPGGGVDIIARLAGPYLGQRLRQPIIVDNRAGAGGTIGLAALVKSPPDGYTLGMDVLAESAELADGKPEFKTFIKEETAKCGTIARQSGARLD